MDYTSIHEEQIRGPADRLELGRDQEQGFQGTTAS